MAMRLRRHNGGLIALCAAETKPEPGDIYINDVQDHAIRMKIEHDLIQEGLILDIGYNRINTSG